MIVLIILVIIAFIVEGLNDFYIWKAYTTRRYKYTKKWHKTNLAEKIIAYSLVSYFASFYYFGEIGIKTILILTAIGLTRLVLLNTTFNLLRDDKIWYFSENSNKIDELLSERPKLAYLTITLMMITNWIIIYYV